MINSIIYTHTSQEIHVCKELYMRRTIRNFSIKKRKKINQEIISKVLKKCLKRSFALRKAKDSKIQKKVKLRNIFIVHNKHDPNFVM